MPLSKDEKQAILTKLEASFSTAKAVVFANYRGTTVKQLNALRDQLDEYGLTFTVTKNTLLKKALSQAGQLIDDAVYNQPVGLTFDTQDEVRPSRLLTTFTKENAQLQILGALVNGSWITDVQVRQFAALPNREQLLGQVVGTVAAPLRGLVTVMAGNLRGLVSVLRQYQEQQTSVL